MIAARTCSRRIAPPSLQRLSSARPFPSCPSRGPASPSLTKRVHTHGANNDALPYTNVDRHTPQHDSLLATAVPAAWNKRGPNSNAKKPSTHTPDGDLRAAKDIVALIQNGELCEALQVWKESRDMIACSPLYFAKVSKALSVHLLAPLAEYPPSPEHVVLLEDLVIFLALNYDQDALFACLLFFAFRHRPFDAVRLHDRFHSEWSQLGEDLLPPPHEGVEVELDALPCIPPPTRELVMPPRASDLITATIAAHALVHDFRGALHTALKYGCRLHTPSLRLVVSSLKVEAEEAQSIRTYVKRANAAVLVQNPVSLSVHLKRIGKVYHLEDLYQTIIDGLGSELTWTALDSRPPSTPRTVHIDEPVFAQFIIAFCRFERLDRVEVLWDDLTRLGHTPTVYMWTVLIQQAATLKGVNYALQLWKTMLASNVHPDNLAYRTLINLLVQARRMNEAAEILREFESWRAASPPGPDGFAEPLYNVVIRGYLNTRQHDRAVSLIEHMKEVGLKPTIVTYNTFMAHYNRMKDYKAVSWVLKKISAEGLQGDAFTYSTLLCSLMAILPYDEAVLRALSLMERQGVEPNAVTYSAIISKLLEERSTEAVYGAMDLLKRMESSDRAQMQPTTITYTNILQALCRRNDLPPEIVTETRGHIERQMRERGVALNKVTYGILINACMKNGTPEGALEGLRYFREMQSRHIQLTADTWYLVLHGLAQRGQWELANELLDEFEDKGMENPRMRRLRWMDNLARQIRRKENIARTTD